MTQLRDVEKRENRVSLKQWDGEKTPTEKSPTLNLAKAGGRGREPDGQEEKEQQHLN